MSPVASEEVGSLELVAPAVLVVLGLVSGARVSVEAVELEDEGDELVPGT
jgi:hypothetical protein